MAGLNSENTGKGRDFQEIAAKLLSQLWGVTLVSDHPIAIGTPPKKHRFDLSTLDIAYAGECKNYSWTETGNVPSAKMGFMNEAVFYLSFLPSSTLKFIVMRRDTHMRHRESLAEYYHRQYHHILGETHLFEIDIELRTIREIR